MTHRADTQTNAPKELPADEGRFPALEGIFALELIAVLIALAMPITPSKTGSDFSPAEWLFGEPSYLQDAAVYFLAANALFLLLGCAIWVWIRVDRARQTNPRPKVTSEKPDNREP